MCAYERSISRWIAFYLNFDLVDGVSASNINEFTTRGGGGK